MHKGEFHFSDWPERLSGFGGRKLSGGWRKEGAGNTIVIKTQQGRSIMSKGRYEKTKYPGIFKYIGKNGEKYGIDYYSAGEKCREIIGPLLGSKRGTGKEEGHGQVRGVLSWPEGNPLFQ